MRKDFTKRILTLVILVSMVLSFFNCVIIPVKVEAKATSLKGTQYKFDKKCKYVISKAKDKKSISGKTQFGEIFLEGNVKKIDKQNGVQAFEVSSGTVSIKYKINTKLDIVKDKVKKVSNASLESNVLKGAIIVQSSLDGENWILDKAYTDVLGDNDDGFKADVFESNDIQQTNGCYFRVVIAYKADIKKGNDIKTYRFAEVYKFYLINKDQGNAIDVNANPKKVFNDDNYYYPVNSNYYDEPDSYDEDDPHNGWSLGRFTINGFTEKYDRDDGALILKNVGDKVTLWYTLEQDINKLNGNEDYVINEDTDGSDAQFNIPKTNLRRGTLIIGSIESDGSIREKAVYTNYLEACTRTGADIKVQLFEEGDYYIKLDYEILDKSGLFSHEYNYMVQFVLRIRNSNDMVFPIDLKTSNELKSFDIAENGFKLDYAESKYLKVSVEYINIQKRENAYSGDTRANKYAKDGAQYTEEGAYIVSVWHDYNSDKKTEKIIFVGNSPIIKCLSKNMIKPNDDGFTSINGKLLQGYVLNDEGEFVEETKEEPEDEEEQEEPENQDNNSDGEDSDDEENEESNDNTDSNDKQTQEVQPIDEHDNNERLNTILVGAGIGAGIVVFIVVIIKLINHKSHKTQKEDASPKNDKEA